MNKSSYIFSLDVMRVLAIWGVIIIHVTNAIFTRPDFFGGSLWWITIILDSLSRVSIPFFILISGFLILRKEESFTQSLNRIFFRIIIPLVFWLIFYMWYRSGIPSITFVNVSIFWRLFFANVYHLYYLVIIIGLYFVAPFLRAYLKGASSDSKIFLMRILLLLGIIEVGLQYIFHACGTENFFTKWVPYTGIFVAGYVLGHDTRKFNKFLLFFGYGAGLIATIGFNYLNVDLLLHKNFFFSPAGCLSNYTDYYLSINVLIMSLCAFILLFYANYQRIQNYAWITNSIQSIARAAFGIYLIQPFVARFLEMQFHLAIDFSPLPLAELIFLKLILVFGISYVITTIGRRIPVVKMVFGER